MTGPESWILKWFQDNTNMLENEINKDRDENYFMKGWIDSLKFISFISDIENKFNISFSNDEFQDRKFATINGIIQILEDKINESI
jgi:acyl carrier protein